MKYILIFFFSLIFSNCFSQTILTLQPGIEDGKDAKIWSIESNVNFGDHAELRAMAWTWFGDAGAERSYLQFDLSQIPIDAEICYAYLSLYANDSASSQTNSSLSGSNITLLRRVITSWEENLVTWISPPSVTTVNQVSIPESAAEYEDVLNIDVTDLVSDMIVDPLNSHGFELRLETESYYRRRVFASSDEPDATHHPKLEICYTITVPIERFNGEGEIKVYPNPTSGPLQVALNNMAGNEAVITITDIIGNLIFVEKFTPVNDLFNYQIPEVVFAKSSGLCFINIVSDEKIFNKTIVINK